MHLTSQRIQINQIQYRPIMKPSTYPGSARNRYTTPYRPIRQLSRWMMNHLGSYLYRIRVPTSFFNQLQALLIREDIDLLLRFQSNHLRKKRSNVTESTLITICVPQSNTVTLSVCR